MDPYAPIVGGNERHESPAERLDRNWSELLQGLRVSQTGIQILSGFLLPLPFQARFSQLNPVLVGVFVAAMVLGALSTALIVAPAVAHRVLFRRHAKDVLVMLANVLALAALVCLALTLSLSLVVVVGFVGGLAAGLAAGGACLTLVLGLWLGLPLALLRRSRSGARKSSRSAV
jgi:hypothetical protein